MYIRVCHTYESLSFKNSTLELCCLYMSKIIFQNHVLIGLDLSFQIWPYTFCIFALNPRNTATPLKTQFFFDFAPYLCNQTSYSKL